jgi:quinone-modifying oxidoreductase, subunit QmoA
MVRPATQSILVVGGGISGLTAALEAAEAGHEVFLVEKGPYLGGRVAQFHQYFPKLCPPSCGLEINFKRLRNNPRVRLMTMTQVKSIRGSEGNWDVSLSVEPRYVNESCTACGKCSDACTLEIDNPFNYGMDKIKAAYLPYDMAFPSQYVIAPALARSEEGARVKEACPYGAVDLSMTRQTVELKVGAIIWATGWKPYDMSKLDTYGAGLYPNVISNVMMERLAASNGPTGGKILRPSDGKEPRRIGFVQCAGSRDDNHLAFCSSVCCLASLKQAMYVRTQYPDAQIHIFFIDIRAMDRLDGFFQAVKREPNIKFLKGKVARIEQDTATSDLTVRVEDTCAGSLQTISLDLVVLATGMQPATSQEAIPAEAVGLDAYGFLSAAGSVPGIHAAGCTRSPENVSDAVQDGTGAALKAIQSVVRR